MALDAVRGHVATGIFALGTVNALLLGGVLERAKLLAERKPGDPHPFVDPETWNERVKAAQENAVKAVEMERRKASAAQ